LLQNTLGTVEGEGEALIEEINNVCHSSGGELVLSLFRREALDSWGVAFYHGLREMVGDIDLQKTDFLGGLFVSRTGYSSKWRSSSEISALVRRLGATITTQVWTPQTCVLHLTLGTAAQAAPFNEASFGPPYWIGPSESTSQPQSIERSQQ
jgi:hypothetical protein